MKIRKNIDKSYVAVTSKEVAVIFFVSGKINLVLPQIFVLTEIIFVKALINVHLKYMNTDFYGRTINLPT